MASFTSNNIGIADSSDDARWNAIGRYWSYQAAQAAVDRLSDASFPIEYVEIVGRDLRLVERVTGRLTNLRAAAAGAGSFAWFGLLIGLLIGLFTTGPAWLGLMLGGLVISAVWGGIFGLSPTGQRTDDASSLRSADSPPRSTTRWSPTGNTNARVH